MDNVRERYVERVGDERWRWSVEKVRREVEKFEERERLRWWWGERCRWLGGEGLGERWRRSGREVGNVGEREEKFEERGWR